jgi:allophanate hydrolase
VKGSDLAVAPANLSLDLQTLRAGYAAGELTPVDVAEEVLRRVEQAPEHHVWIHRLAAKDVLARAGALLGRRPEDLPLYGVPFAIKDNIDVAGVPTTAACPEFAYVPERSAAVVERLLAAGAMPVGKTNLDQFATGLVGTRSPYGACRNAFDPEFISGGSSSGSAVAVALGLVAFSLGTDTAGSGRVPAAFNNLIGLKPTRGLLSTRGVVPACRSLDCVSVFALTADDARAVLDVAEGFDLEDPCSRRRETPRLGPRALPAEGLRFGVPRPAQLVFFGDDDYARLFGDAVGRLEALGGQRVEIDLGAFLDAARLLYEGPWLAERYAAVGRFLETHPSGVHPVTRAVIEPGRHLSAVQAFEGEYRLKALLRATEATWDRIDALVVPTAGTVYRIAEVEADPVGLNANLGRYTNFMNLLDLSAVAVPAGFRPDGLPFGVTLVAPAFYERGLLRLADRLHRSAGVGMGATGHPLPAAVAVPGSGQGTLPLAVCGAHMSGLALNPQLTERGGRLLARTRTAPRYRLYALPGGPPARPGLVRAEGGDAIEVEVWALPAECFGSFLAEIPPPLGIGWVELADGRRVPGFLCEAYAVQGADEITALGGWRAYLQARAAGQAT